MFYCTVRYLDNYTLVFSSQNQLKSPSSYLEVSPWGAQITSCSYLCRDFPCTLYSPVHLVFPSTFAVIHACPPQKNTPRRLSENITAAKSRKCSKEPCPSASLEPQRVRDVSLRSRKDVKCHYVTFAERTASESVIVVVEISFARWQGGKVPFYCTEETWGLILSWSPRWLIFGFYLFIVSSFHTYRRAFL